MKTIKYTLAAAALGALVALPVTSTPCPGVAIPATAMHPMALRPHPQRVSNT